MCLVCLVCVVCVLCVPINVLTVYPEYIDVSLDLLQSLHFIYLVFYYCFQFYVMFSSGYCLFI